MTRRFQPLAANAPVGLFLTDRSGAYVEVNRRWCELTGIDSASAMGAAWLEAVHADHRARVVAKWRSCVTEQETFRAEYQLSLRTDAPTWVSVEAVPQFDETHAVVAFLGAFTDISVCKLAQQRLGESETRFRMLSERSPDLVWSTDGDGIVTYMSPAVERMFGVPAADLLGKPFGGTMTEDSRLDAARLFESARAAGRRLARFEYCGRTATGTLRRFEVNAAAVHSADGQLQSVEGVTRDITERHAEHVAYKRIAHVVECAAELIVTTDLDGTITYVNPAFLNCTGFSEAEAVGQNLRIMKSGQHDPEFYAELWHTLREGTPWRGRFDNRTRDGRPLIEDAVVTPLWDDRGNVSGYAKVARDVTHEMALDTQVRALQKSEALGTLASGIAHDFNNILSSITGFTEMALQQVASDSLVHADLVEVKTAARRATELVEQIRRSTSHAESVPEPLQIRPLFDEVVGLLRAAFPATIEMKVDSGGGDAVVLAEPAQIHQILMNLCTNAGFAMPSGGVLSLSLTQQTCDVASDSPVGALPAGRYAVVTVRDTGVGIPPDQLDAVFDPYYTTKGREEGTGLGLAIVQTTAKALGGRVLVSSTMGEGTTFHVYLPIYEQTDSQTESEPLPAVQPPSRGSESIVVVDDERPIREIAARILESVGYSVTACASAADALAALTAEPDRYELLLTDLTMPGMNGLELSREVKALLPGLPIILWSGFADSVSPATLDAIGIAALCSKPVTRDGLARAVRQVLDAQRAAVETS